MTNEEVKRIERVYKEAQDKHDRAHKKLLSLDIGAPFEVCDEVLDESQFARAYLCGVREVINALPEIVANYIFCEFSEFYEFDEFVERCKK